MEGRAKRELKPLPKRHGPDFLLFLGILAICAYGLVMMYSASYYYGLTSHADGYFFLKRQIVFFGIGMAAIAVCMLIPYRFFRKGWVVIALYTGCVALLAATLKWGTVTHEARRWLDLGFFSLQPSELFKVVLIMVYASIMSRGVNMQHPLIGVLPCLLVLVIPCVLIILQPNLSMVVIICVLAFIMLYLGGVRWVHLGIIAGAGLAGGIGLAFIKGYRADRILGFLSQKSDLLGKNYQMNQARIALGSGGFFGRGLNFSRQKLGYLPERENDYILAIIGEELGFIGILVLLALYFFVIWRCIRVALKAPDRYGRLLAGGLAGLLALQVILNVAVVTGSMPTTGQTLPFVSYGGTSMVVFLSAMGLVLSVSRYTEETTKNAGTNEQK